MTYGIEHTPRTKMLARDVTARKGGSPISMLTIYDVQMARLAEQAGIDAILIGDSMAMTVYGLKTTASITLDQVIGHARAVRRGAPNTHLVGDLPFMTYHTSTESAIANAGRLIAEAEVDAVKLEGGEVMADRIHALTRIGIPVMAHIGLLPQTASAQGGFKVQGKDVDTARRLLADAHAVTDAGAYAVVVEMVGAELARRITATIPIPTIGIGAGVWCDGQVLVGPDMLGMDEGFRPRFVKPYANLAGIVRDAFAAFHREVHERAFPDPEHTFSTPRATREALDLDTSE